MSYSKIGRAIILAAVFFAFFWLSAAAQENNDDERRQLELELADLENQIVEQEVAIQRLRTQGKSLQSEISRYNANIEKLNLKIRAVNLQITKLDKGIGQKEVEIRNTEEKIDFNKDALGRALRQVYENSQQGLIEVLLLNPRLSDFFGDINNLLEVQDSLTITIDKITILKNELIDQRETLSLQRTDASALKAARDAQKTSLQSIKNEKGNLLTVTRGEEARYQNLLKETKKTAAQIRSRIFQLLGGGELTFEQAYQFAKLAEGATGVRAALILAVLDRESALGQNVGRCSYKTAMHPSRDIPVFLEITAKLGINPDSIQVSCANSDGAYGGAMGPAQFIPSTWALYEAGIAAVTGNSPASPWRNADAFVATGLYLKDSLNSGACVNYANQYSHLLSRQVLEERCAAAKYYAGSRWFTYRFAYGDPVVERANRFQQDIDILNS